MWEVFSFMKFEFLEHTADVKFRAYGKTLEEVFENSALAMINSQYSGKIKKVIKKKIKVEGENVESLLYNFLEEVLYLIDASGFLASEFKVKISGDKLEATIEGDLVKNYKFSLDLKAVTYNEMFVKKEKGKWVSQVVLDV